MTALYEVTKQALAFTMRDFSTVRDFEAAKAVLQDTIRSALIKEEKAVAWLAERKEHWRKEKEKIQATDPELSAALGWPGGISDPVLDRKVLLQMVAAMRLASQQALEALEMYRKMMFVEAGCRFGEGDAVITALRAALRAVLAQQAEPRNQCRSDGRCQYAIDHGAEGMGHCPKGKCVMAQHTQPAEDRDVAQSNLRVMKEMFREQAEPAQMHPSQFAELIKGKEAIIGVPVYWSEWPTKEKQ